MALYTADVLWERGEQNFLDNKYSRNHRLRFDGGIEVHGSASPHVVPLPFSDPAAVDPEEAFVSSLSCCHMLWFLSIAAKSGFRVDRYFDAAVGTMALNAEGKMAVTQVRLRPAVEFSGAKQPSRAQIDQLHQDAHAQCFIAHSVRSDVLIEPVYPSHAG